MDIEVEGDIQDQLR